MIVDSMKSKKDYIFDEMVKAGWNDVAFLEESALLERWSLQDDKKLRTFLYGRNARGLRLPVIRLGRKTRRYRPSDVLEFEYEAMDR